MVRSVASAAANKKNNPNETVVGWTLNKFINGFYRSRYNRDNMHDLAEGEDENDSKMYRIYNKGDLKDVAEAFLQYLEWLIIDSGIGVNRIYLATGISLRRETRLPHINRANEVDIMKRKGDDGVKVGDYYITKGKYTWYLDITGEPFKRMKESQKYDPAFIAKVAELQPIVDERNANANKERENKSTE